MHILHIVSEREKMPALFLTLEKPKGRGESRVLAGRDETAA